jgi:hypothetical protein
MKPDGEDTAEISVFLLELLREKEPSGTAAELERALIEFLKYKANQELREKEHLCRWGDDDCNNKGVLLSPKFWNSEKDHHIPICYECWESFISFECLKMMLDNYRDAETVISENIVSWLNFQIGKE